MKTTMKSEELKNGNDQIIIYQDQNGATNLDVRLENETVWLNRQQMSELFNRDIKTIGKHINNALNEELKGFSVVAKFATTAIDGKTYQVEHYNLDMILSIGYRIKSSQGIQFRACKFYLFCCTRIACAFTFPIKRVYSIVHNFHQVPQHSRMKYVHLL